MKNKKFIIILLLFSALLSVFRQIIFWDTAVYIKNGSFFLSGSSSYFEILRPPLFSIFMGIFNNILFARFSIAILYSVFILLVYNLFREYNHKTATAACIFLATNPITAFWGTELLTHTLANIFLVSAVFFMFKQKDILSGFFLGLVFLTRYVTISVSVAIAIYLFYRKKPLRVLKISIVSFIVISPWLIWNYSNYGNPFFSLINAAQVFSWSPDIGALFYLKSVAPIFGLMLVLIPFSFSKIKDDKIKFSIIWIILGLILLSSFNHKELRFTFFIIPPAAFLAGAGFSNLNKKYYKVSLILFSLIIILNLLSFNGMYKSYNSCSQENLISSSAYAVTLISDSQTIASNQWPLVSYFSDRRTMPFIVWRDSTPSYFLENNVGVIIIQNSTSVDSQLISDLILNDYSIIERNEDCLDIYILN